MLHSRPKSAVGTPAYIAPEVLSRREYDGKVSLSPLDSFMNYMFSCFYYTFAGYSVRSLAKCPVRLADKSCLKVLLVDLL